MSSDRNTSTRRTWLVANLAIPPCSAGGEQPVSPLRLRLGRNSPSDNHPGERVHRRIVADKSDRLLGQTPLASDDISKSNGCDLVCFPFLTLLSPLNPHHPNVLRSSMRTFRSSGSISANICHMGTIIRVSGCTRPAFRWLGLLPFTMIPATPAKTLGSGIRFRT